MVSSIRRLARRTDKGSQGYTLLDLNSPGRHDVGMAVALRPAARSSSVPRPPCRWATPHQRVAVVRFSAEGQLDTAFGEPDGAGGRKGLARAPSFYTSDDAADYLSGFALSQSGALGPDGQPRTTITVVGTPSPRQRIFIGRLTADGDIDTTLSSLDPVSGVPRSGSAPRRWSQQWPAYRSVEDRRGARSSAGRLLVAGSGGDRMKCDAFPRQRQPRHEFRRGGSALRPGRVTLKISDIQQLRQANALALQGNGKILVADSPR